MVLGAIGTLTRAASKARLDRFDKRTAAGRLLHDARRDFEAHLGGVEEISATECALIGRLAMRTLVIALVDVSPLFPRGRRWPSTSRSAVDRMWPVLAPSATSGPDQTTHRPDWTEKPPSYTLSLFRHTWPVVCE